jgi:hypothetical protein
VERKCDHLLGDILVIGLLTMLCGGESFNDMEDFGKAKKDWLRTFLRLRRFWQSDRLDWFADRALCAAWHSTC